MLIQKQFNKQNLLGDKKKLDPDYNGTDAGNVQSMLILRILEKIKETRFSQASVAVL